DDEELPAEPIDGPKKPKKFPKLKNPEDEPETDATLPLDREPNEDEEVPSEPEEQLPTAKPKRTPKKRKPASRTPTRPKKYPKLKEPDDEPDTDANLPLGKTGPDDDQKPKKSKKGSSKPSKPRWIPPIKPPEEPIPMPPKEKSIFDRNKEEKIPPTERYSKKPRSLDVYIPFIIPWEQTPAIMTQEGMGAFGTQRDISVTVDHGSKELKQGALNSEVVLPLLNDARAYANRSGMQPFGAKRLVINGVIDNHKYMNQEGGSESVIPLLSRGAVSHGNLTFGDLRPQVANVKYTDAMDPGMDKMSHSFVSRQFVANSKDSCGTNIIDRRRGEIAPCGPQLRASECMIPMMFDGRAVELREGSEFGSFRPVITEVM
ncbi:hypothetical protein NECAME_16712, partial [Necator americanus]